MQKEIRYTEKNIEKLLNSSFDKIHQLDKQLKNDTLQLLEQKVAQNSKESQPENKIAIGLSIVWLGFLFIIFSELRISIYMLDWLKPALVLSLVFIPVSSIVLIVLKKSFYEKKLV
jgi:hypothetical protein